MFVFFDIAVIAILALSIFLGYKQGLIGVIFKIVAFIIAILITLILYKPVANLIIQNTTWDDKIEATIYEKLSGTNIEEGQKLEKEQTELPGMVVNYINDGIETTVKQAKDNVAEMVAKNLTTSIIQIITMLVIFTVTRLLLLFAKVLLETLSELPIVKQFNEIGGLLYGILRGLVILYAILALASVILPMVGQTTILEQIDHTLITKFLYNYNFILILFF